jgi:hypothetical protein
MQKNKVRGAAATIVASIVGLVGLGVIAVVVHGFAIGWLIPYWINLEDAQASLISGVATMYAAIFVATVVPVLFGGLIGDLQKATKQTVSDLKADTDLALHELRDKFDELAAEFRDTVRKNREASDSIVGMVDEAKQSLNTLMHYQLLQIGFKRNYAEVDLPNAKSILKECHSTLELICQGVLDQSRLRGQRRSFDNRWVGYKPYIDTLKSLGLVDDDRHRLMLRVADSRRYLKPDADTISLIQLNLVASAADDLRTWFEREREGPSHASVIASAGNGVGVAH